MRRIFGAAVATAGLVLGLAPAAQSQVARSDVILAGSASQVDYHAEAAPARPADGGSTIIGGNIHIKSERGTRGGDAGACDPDPRFGTHPRPEDDGCTWAEPRGAGEDFIAFGRTIQNDAAMRPTMNNPDNIDRLKSRNAVGSPITLTPP